jgi:hypothetical protein
MSKAKRGRPRNAPGTAVDNKLTPRMELAITAIVQDNKSRDEAAKLAGLTPDAIRKAMRNNSAARAFYNSELKELRNFAKSIALHALIAECTGPNASARVAAARTLVEDGATALPGSSAGQIPGLVIQIINTRASQQPMPIDVTPLNRPPVSAV